MLDLLRRYGWNATSFQLIEPEYKIWFDEQRDAAVAFIDTGSARVAGGPPLASDEILGDVAQKFVRNSRRKRKRVAFFAVEERFLRSMGMHAMEIGVQCRWNPQNWIEQHRGHRSLKEQLRRARAKGVTIDRVPSEKIRAQRKEIEHLMSRWLGTRPMPRMSFLVELNPFAFAEERRYYAARVQGKLYGLLVAVPVYARNGWFFRDILRDPDAPNGTAESLVNAAMLDVAQDGATFATLGLIPLGGEAWWQRKVRRAMCGFYNFEGLKRFKTKLRPEAWDPIYLAWPRGLGILALYDVLNAFAAGSLPTFAVRAVLRGPAPVLFVMGVLAVPWAALLAMMDSEQWFPSRAVQWTWVMFDMAMAAILIVLSRRWHRRLGTVAAIAAATDAVLTTIEAATYNVRRVRNTRDAAIVAIAVAAPIFVSAILITRLLR